MFDLVRRGQPCDRDNEPQRLERPGRSRRPACECEHEDGRRREAETTNHREQYTTHVAPPFRTPSSSLVLGNALIMFRSCARRAVSSVPRLS